MSELPVLDFFFEEDCPFCRSVRINIIEKLQEKGIVIINPIEVDVNTGAVEMGWYNSFCREVKSEPTPLLRLHDKLIGENNWEFAFLMWKKKPMTITEEVLSSEEYLEKQIYDKIRLMNGTCVLEVQPSYKLERDLYLANRRLGLDARVY
jgi:thiol-disulfide isomerase/thioredoxin